MTKTTLDLTELLQKHDQGDLLRSIAEAVLQLMMESDVDGLIGAGRHERAEQRTTWRNGYRDRSLDTRLVCGGGGGPGTQLSLTIDAWSLVVPSENANKASQALVGL